MVMDKIFEFRERFQEKTYKKRKAKLEKKVRKANQCLFLSIRR